MLSLSQIISLWQTLKVPTSAQRIETFSSFRHKEDNVPISEVDGLTNALNSKVNTSSLNTILALKSDKLTEPVTATVAVGYAQVGTVFPQGMTFTEYVKAVHTPPPNGSFPYTLSLNLS